MQNAAVDTWELGPRVGQPGIEVLHVADGYRTRMVREGLPVGDSKVRVARAIPAPSELADTLGLPPGGTVIRRRAVVRDEGGPLEITTSWFDSRLATIAPRLLDASAIPQGALAYLQQATNRRCCIGRDLVRARLATDEEARNLGLTGPPRIAVLVIRHVPLDDHGQPLAVVEAVFPPDRWVLEQEYRLPG